MPKIHVSNKIKLNASVHKAFEIISDFNTWTAWSPWLIQEPEAKVIVADDTKSYEWEGDRVGAGKMKIVQEKKNKSIEIDLVFLKPWKSTAKVFFNLSGDKDSCEIEWTMNSSLPFFLFWMKKQMQVFIGMDYDRGLRLLKDFIEDDQTHSELKFIGENNFETQKFIGINTNCTKETMAKKMTGDIPKLVTFLNENKIDINGDSFTQYHKWEMVKNKISYTVGIPVKEVPDSLPHGFVAGEIPKSKVYTIEHIGSYHHLGNAWTTLYSMQRLKEIKCNSKIDPFETYITDPNSTSPEETVTRIHFPLD